jgi:hypothetical protein
MPLLPRLSSLYRNLFRKTQAELPIISQKKSNLFFVVVVFLFQIKRQLGKRQRVKWRMASGADVR